MRAVAGGRDLAGYDPVDAAARYLTPVHHHGVVPVDHARTRCPDRRGLEVPVDLATPAWPCSRCYPAAAGRST